MRLISAGVSAIPIFKEKTVFTLNPEEFGQFDWGQAPRFVKFWSQFYHDRVAVLGAAELIDYFMELNVERDLTEENVRRLLRWKDPRHLTHRVNGGQDNPRVVRVLNNLAAINRFRNDQVAEDEMRNTVAQVFPNGIVFQVFLLHIAKPHSYPIADQHVFRAFSLHTGQKTRENWETYVAYRDYFGQIAQAIKVAQERGIENVRRLKRIDNALMVFGQFLNTYCSQ
jgi:hypothetical protein